MSEDDVFWSSKMQKYGLVWVWKATIYGKPDRGRLVKSSGWALTYGKALRKLNRWIADNGESPMREARHNGR